MPRVVAVLLVLASIAACSKKSPTSPSQPPPTATRIIGIAGDLHFGNVEVTESRTKVIRVSNSGTDTLNITSITGPHASVFSATPTVSSIPAGASQDITFSCTPAAATEYSGTVTLVSNATGGASSTAISCFGVRTGPLWRREGTGDDVFDMPSYVSRVKVIGVYNGCSSNFIVRVGGRLLVNELVGTCWSSTRYEGTLLSGGGGQVAITNSSGVAWSFEEAR